MEGQAFDNIVISPGPGTPERAGDFGIAADALRRAQLPILTQTCPLSCPPAPSNGAVEPRSSGIIIRVSGYESAPLAWVANLLPALPLRT